MSEISAWLDSQHGYGEEDVDAAHVADLGQRGAHRICLRGQGEQLKNNINGVFTVN